MVSKLWSSRMIWKQFDLVQQELLWTTSSGGYRSWETNCKLLATFLWTIFLLIWQDSWPVDYEKTTIERSKPLPRKHTSVSKEKIIYFEIHWVVWNKFSLSLSKKINFNPPSDKIKMTTSNETKRKSNKFQWLSWKIWFTRSISKISKNSFLIMFIPKAKRHYSINMTLCQLNFVNGTKSNSLSTWRELKCLPSKIINNFQTYLRIKLSC